MARILIIDDDDPARFALRAILEHADHEVLEASNGLEGVKRFREEAPDLVITDILMPEKEGLETIQELRRDFPQIRIIAISGSGANYLSWAEEFGALRTFLKPFDRKEILAAVQDLLGENR